MTADASAGARGEGDTSTEYDEMLETLDVAIEEARRKVESGRVYDADNEATRVKWVRALAYSVSIRRQVAESRDLEELNERLDRLEERREREGGATV